MTQDELKAAVAREAIRHVVDGAYVGVGTGSTANLFIDELGKIRTRIRGAIASSVNSAQRLAAHGIPVLDLNEVDDIPVYVDGADQITRALHMIKGGGGALTREKIVAAVAKKFVCIADESKLVQSLGRYALPVEVIPMASQRIVRQFAAIGGQARIRLAGSDPVVTDNGQHLLDVSGLHITDPLAFESMVNQWPGVVTVGVFAHQKADLCLLGTTGGVRTIHYD